MSKTDIDLELEKAFDPDFIKLWWGLKLPGLGGKTPTEVWEEDPQIVFDYVDGYSED